VRPPPAAGKGTKPPRTKVKAKPTASPPVAATPQPPQPTPKTKEYKDWVMDMDP
jgi:hypothetical protein